MIVLSKILAIKQAVSCSVVERVEVESVSLCLHCLAEVLKAFCLIRLTLQAARSPPV